MQTVLENSRDAHVRPEFTAISAVAPAFVFNPALSHANFELLCRLFILKIIFTVKYGKMLANDILFSVALQQLCTSVPGSDITLCVEEEYGVIFDRLNKDSECFVCGQSALW